MKGLTDVSRYDDVKQELIANPKVWAVTGVAGFIGSNLLETLLKLDQRVVGLDNFATGHRRNLDEVRSLVTPEQWNRFTSVQADIREINVCRRVCAGAHYVLHQAALGSVPRSLADPIATNEANVSGFLNMLVAARDAKVKRFVYAASSSTYGDHPALPKVEHIIGNPLSPYAVTKLVNELYSAVFARTYDFDSIGLRYFNVFGRRQDPNGAYAAVIPKWTAAMIEGRQVVINGDGETSRDFCYIDNVVQANILAAIVEILPENNHVFNVAFGERTTLNELYYKIRKIVSDHVAINPNCEPLYTTFRPGDVRHSLADIGSAMRILKYSPSVDVSEGLVSAIPWYVRRHDDLRIGGNSKTGA